MVDNIKKRFGLNVKKYRELRDLTQDQVATYCGCSPQTISGMETGYSFPNSNTLFKLPEILSVPLAYLFNFDEDEDLQLSENVSLLVESYSKLSKSEQNVILKVVKELSHSRTSCVDIKQN